MTVLPDVLLGTELLLLSLAGNAEATGVLGTAGPWPLSLAKLDIELTLKILHCIREVEIQSV